RIAAKEYTFEQFTEVEVADFNQDQITIFAQNWFRLSDPVKAERFIQKLEKHKRIQELATNPLLLTLLCLVFGEAGNFPANRSELYKEGLDVLLKKWDAKRNIERDQVYKNLSVQRKEDLLSQIALTTFKHKDYFFKQKTVEEYIAEFIRNLYKEEEPNQKELKLDSEAVLKSIEAQHGLLVERAKSIYSFSHLTFQEYFAAREIVANHAYKNLVEYITEKSWREVLLLTAGMLRNADKLMQLMKRKIDRVLMRDEKLQQFLAWANQKALSIHSDYKLAAIRAFYVGLGFCIDCEIECFFNLCYIKPDRK
ncbi:MAG: signal transduction protein, partial [Moorea sp. SIO4A3]|nr:signal transduction protein [Moorena sp. SIO4A3]